MSSNYPGGFSSGVIIRGLPLTVAHPGEIFWVNSTAVLAKGASAGSDGNKGDYKHPFATIDYAVGRCLANRGDIIMVMPGHSEDIDADSALDLDVAGVAVVGLGSGADRPDLNFSATAGTVEMDAANCTLYNLTLTADVSAVVVGVNIDASGCTIDNCEFNFTSTGDDFKTMIDCDTVSDFTLSNSRLIGEDNVAGGLIGVRLDTDTHTLIENNYIIGEFATGSIVGEGAAGVQALIRNNVIYNADTAGGEVIDLNVAHTGMLVKNACGTLFTTAPETAFDPGSCLSIENYVCNNVDESGTIVPTGIST